MFSFFDEVSQFINQWIQSNADAPYYKQLFNFILNACNIILGWIRGLGLTPLFYAWEFPLAFLALFSEWRARHKSPTVFK